MRTLLSSILVSLFLIGCGGEKKNHGHEGHDHASKKVEKEEDLKPVVYDAEKSKAPQAYLKLSECLIASNPTAAQTYAKKLEAVMPKEGAEAAAKAVNDIIATEDLAAQRKSFEVVTAYFYEVAKSGEAGMDIYLVHCPMAFNNTGANWLSGTKEVVNPYFGDQMLHCGRVMETISGK